MDHHHHHQSMATTPKTASTCSRVSKNKISKKQQQGQGGGERSSRGSGGGGGNSSSPPAMMRKGPWTEEEDAQLVWFVRLFGERRWDFLAKVSGLRRTGKSCRLRWVNYLHPGLRRGRITADEERLILQLHAQWGSRWSRIARSLPGRTDNEIKNFWRTRARKQKAAAAAQQDSRSSKTASASAFSGSSSASSCSGSPSPSSGGCGTATTSSSAVTESALRRSGRSGDDEDDAEVDEASTTTAASQHQHHHQHQRQQQQEECYTSEHLFWNDIAAAEAASYMLLDGWAGAGAPHPPAATVEPPSSPTWEYCSDYSLWRIDDDEYYNKMLDSSS